MWDKQAISSLLTLLAGVAAAVALIALQPEPADDLPDRPASCAVVAKPGQPACAPLRTSRRP